MADMLVMPGAPEWFGSRVSRRRWLEIGGLGALGVALSDLPSGAKISVAGEAVRRGPGFGRAKSCILLFLFGAPAHQDTWDLKPEAPVGIRGEFGPIATATPGLQIGEHLPLLATRSARYAIVRSVTHADNTHTVAMHHMLTGVRHKRPTTNPQNAPDDFPCFGALSNYLEQRGVWRRAVRAGLESTARSLPAAVSLNAPANQVSANNHIFPGFFAGFLGSRFDPLFVSRSAHQPEFHPFVARETPARLIERQQLSTALRAAQAELSELAATKRLGQEQERAVTMLTSPGARLAFDVESESRELRERYGLTPFGQGCLVARRLIEQGVPLVTVNWERDDAYWDTHSNNFVDLKKKLLPNFDRGFAALLDDLAERGLLDDTLVVALGEFGRTPQINKNAGRDHWAACNSVVLAGAGFGGGAVYGASDRWAAYPAHSAVTPDDLAATIYHLLGIDPEWRVPDPTGRPFQVAHGQPIWPLLG